MGPGILHPVNDDAADDATPPGPLGELPTEEGAEPSGESAEPPADPEAWSDEEWLGWLEDVDAKTAREELPRLTPWRQKTLGIQMLSASMFGLFEAMYGARDEPAIVIQVSGDPPGNDPIEPHLDPIKPSSSTVIVRPWLMKGND